MARRRRSQKRTPPIDPVYNSSVIGKFINKVMLNGKKQLAQTIVYRAVEQFAKKVGAENPLQAFEKALENASPRLKVKSKRIGGATYQVPTEIDSDTSASMGMRWIIQFSRQKVGRNMVDSLCSELCDCYQNQGTTIKKKDDTHRMAEANRALAHYKT